MATLSYQPEPIEAHYNNIFYRYLGSQKEVPPQGLERAEVWLPPAERRVNTMQEEKAFMRELVDMIRRECADPQGEWARNPQFSAVAGFSGFPLVEKYLQGGQVRLYAGEPQEQWIVIRQNAEAFRPGTPFRI